MKYTTLLFDIDNTILDFEKDEKIALTKTLKENGLPYDEETTNKYSYFNSIMWKKFEKGEATKADIQNNRFRMLIEYLGVETEKTPREINDMYEVNLRLGGIPIEGTKEVLNTLKKDGYRLYAVTNGLKLSQENRGRHSGIDVFFENVFISECVGYQKPTKEYFDYVFDNIDEKDKSKILLIGDSLSSDIKGAQNAGIDSLWINPKSAVNNVCENATYEGKHIRDIFEILK